MSDLSKRLRDLADKFSEGWHDGIKIDASDIELLADAAAALAEQSEPYIYLDPDTGETWTVGAIEDGCRPVDGLIALYTTPPHRVPLTPEAIWSNDEIMSKSQGKLLILDLVDLVRAIEQVHGITGEKT